MHIGKSGKAVDELAQVLSIDGSGGHSIRALLSAPTIAAMARPMQFVMVRVGNGTDPFLRRPFGLSHIDAESGIIGINWDVVGRGTELMAAWEPGQSVSVLGPLGNGVEVGSPVGSSADLSIASDVNSNSADMAMAQECQGSGDPRSYTGNHLFLIAGGTGLAPMLPLASKAAASGWEVSLFYGARTAQLLMDCSDLSDRQCRVELATDDGSAGVKGFVTDLASHALEGAGSGDLAIACGPTPMTRAVKALCARLGVVLYVSLEERMACGTGLCKGCAVKKSGADGYYHVCTDGPVFRASEVDLGGEKR